MAYSNITPPTLPEHDSALYSHYVLEFEYENGSDNWFAVSLRYSSTPFTYDGAAVTNAGEHHLQTYGSGTGEWTYWGTLTEMSIAPGTTSTGGYRRIWTNHNILDGSGKVWLAANTATPAEANLDRLSIMKRKLAGLIMAWCAPVRQFPQREPVAFLYGHVAKEGETPTHTINGVGYVGVAAPKIPVVEGYDNALIVEMLDSPGNYQAFYSAEKAYAPDDSAAKYDGPCRAFYYYPDFKDNWNAMTVEGSQTFSELFYTVLWANHDILNSDGAVYFGKSETIPIYE